MIGNFLSGYYFCAIQNAFIPENTNSLVVEVNTEMLVTSSQKPQMRIYNIHSRNC